MANMLVTAPIHVSLRTFFLTYLFNYSYLKFVCFQVIFAVSFSTVVYGMTDQPVELDRFLKYSVIYILLNIIGDSMGLTIGAMLDPIVSCL